LIQRLCPAGHLSPVLIIEPGHPCDFTILVITVLQEWTAVLASAFLRCSGTVQQWPTWCGVWRTLLQCQYVLESTCFQLGITLPVSSKLLVVKTTLIYMVCTDTPSVWSLFRSTECQIQGLNFWLFIVIILQEHLCTWIPMTYTESQRMCLANRHKPVYPTGVLFYHLLSSSTIHRTYKHITVQTGIVCCLTDVKSVSACATIGMYLARNLLSQVIFFVVFRSYY
jgi:hypothetical protein